MLDQDRDLSGTLLGGRYRLRRRVAEGGMGAVYEAWQEDLRRPVAVKVIAGQKPDDAAIARFQREARAAAALGHPHIVQVYDFQVPANEPPFLVMELLPGPSLADVLRTQGAMRPERAARIAHQVLDALAAAHAVGIVHRDIKPANIAIVTSATLGEIAKVLDFGVAKLAESTTGPLSAIGLVGTIAYMAPEQAAGMEVDGRADVYSVAVCLYMSVTLQRPFEGDTADQVLRAVISGTHKPLSQVRPDVDAWFANIVERGMATDRNVRYASAQAMASELDAWLAQRVSNVPHTPRGVSAAPAATMAATPPQAMTAAALNAPTLSPSQITRGGTQRAHASGAKSTLPLAAVFGALFGVLFVGGGAAAFFLTRPDVLGRAPEGPSATAQPSSVGPVVPPPSSPDATVTPPPSALSRVAPAPTTKADAASPRAPAGGGNAKKDNLGAACSAPSDCTTPNAQCSGGQCACVAGYSFCPGVGCVILRFDADHCGACGAKCEAPNSCNSGHCQPCNSIPFHAVCNNVCIDTRLDVKNCGSCGRACNPGELCTLGVCKK